jgi:hydrogenase expression/formation protein HypE
MGERQSAPRGSRTEEQVLDAIEKRRRRPRRKLLEDQITLSHGAGGKSTHALIEALFLQELRNPMLEPLADSALFTIRDGAAVADEAGGTITGPRFAFSTDSFVVKPLFFPGGDIGELAVNGTLNDLAMAGASPICLSAGFIVEEGLAVGELSRIVASMAAAARAAGVTIATGDTKVVERGKGDGVYINTTGVGVVQRELELSPSRIRPGDRVLVSGTLGDHGMAIMIARGELELEVELESDTAPLHDLVRVLLGATGVPRRGGRPPGGGGDGSVRCLRDPTRGGLATVLAEVALQSELSISIEEQALPVRPEVNGACEILGIDPLYVANEGKLCAIVAPEVADRALDALRCHPLGRDAAIVAEVGEEPPGLVLLETAFGGSRVVDMLAGDPLPRIC